jgi:DNA-binding response OmpR family regulator
MPRILLVDDDTSLLRCLSEYLEERLFEVGGTGSGADVIRLVFQEQPDLVLLSAGMAAMAGWQVLEKLRQVSDVPVILLAGKTTEADKLRGYSLGADDYISKPFSFAELTARIEAVLKRAGKRAAAEDQPAIWLGDVLLDFGKRNAFRGEELIPLAPTELRLLAALAKRNGDAVEENTLIKEVWGDFRQEETAAVRRYVWMLRQKIEKDPANPRHILTVRGFGYRLHKTIQNQE